MVLVCPHTDRGNRRGFEDRDDDDDDDDDGYRYGGGGGGGGVYTARPSARNAWGLATMLARGGVTAGAYTRSHFSST
jgi:hypothetical protein